MTGRPPGTVPLLDANVLIALVIEEHEHHGIAQGAVHRAGGFALCPIVEGALVRYLLRVGESGATAGAVLTALQAAPGHRFIADDLSFRAVDVAALRGHRQATDAYLATLALHHGTRLATFDAALAGRRPDACDLLTG